MYYSSRSYHAAKLRTQDNKMIEEVKAHAKKLTGLELDKKAAIRLALLILDKDIRQNP